MAAAGGEGSGSAAGGQFSSRSNSEALSRLHRDLTRCSSDVKALHQLTGLEADADEVLGVAKDVDEQLDVIRDKYAQILRKQVAGEVYKLEHLLDQLKKHESPNEWKQRQHKQLCSAVKTYQDYHLRVKPPY